MIQDDLIDLELSKKLQLCLSNFYFYLLNILTMNHLYLLLSKIIFFFVRIPKSFFSQF